MAVESAADRAAVLADFGEILVLPGSVEVTVIFDDPYIEELDISMSVPEIHGLTSDLSSLSCGDSVTRQSDSQGYKVAEIKPDGTGMSSIRLEVFS